MTGDELANALLTAVIAAVPQWYEADHGKNPQTILLHNVTRTFFSHRLLTERLRKLRRSTESELERWYHLIADWQPTGVTEVIQERMAREWLKLLCDEKQLSVDWNGLLKYAHEVRSRTHENEPVTFNLVIDGGDDRQGHKHIADEKLSKLLDPIGASERVFIRVDRSLRFLGYEEIGHAYDGTPPGCSPQFSHPFVSKLKGKEFSAHLTRTGDFIVTAATGLVASQRKGRWHLYDMPTFTNAFSEMLNSPNLEHRRRMKPGSDQLAAWVLQLTFDLSYRRHGALLVYDPGRLVLKQASFDAAGPAAEWRKLVCGSLEHIPLNSPRANELRKRVLELASLDGAVLFDDEGILTFGAMINRHERVGPHPGARTLAAKSAYEWGGLPVKISADGDVTMRFRTTGNGDACGAAEIHFL